MLALRGGMPRWVTDVHVHLEVMRTPTGKSTCGWLVQEKDARLRQQLSRDADTPSLAARQAASECIPDEAVSHLQLATAHQKPSSQHQVVLEGFRKTAAAADIACSCSDSSSKLCLYDGIAHIGGSFASCCVWVLHQ